MTTLIELKKERRRLQIAFAAQLKVIDTAIAIARVKARMEVPDADLLRPLVEKFRRTSPSATPTQIAHELNLLGCKAPLGRRWSKVSIVRCYSLAR